MNDIDVKAWVENGPSPKLLEDTRILGKQLAEKRLTTSQIRQVFTKLKAIEAKGYHHDQKIEFMMLKPFLAYAAGRQNNDGLREFKERMTCGIETVIGGDIAGEAQRFKNFCKLFEAVLAYHKAHGGN
jgi:CRISPR-associated protein Csm2